MRRPLVRTRDRDPGVKNRDHEIRERSGFEIEIELEGSICIGEEISGSLIGVKSCLGSGITMTLVRLKSREIKRITMNPMPMRFKPS